jgi:hypothetical protein
LESAHGIVLSLEAAVVEEDDDLAGVVCASSGRVESIKLCLY